MLHWAMLHAFLILTAGKLINMWRRASDATCSFFMPSAQQSVDPLADLVRQQPVAGARFIRWVVGFGSSVSLIVVTACAVFLSQNWEQAGNCARPLRLWLAVYTWLNACGVPVRVLFLAKVLPASNSAETLRAAVESITASPAWQVSKKVSLVIYAWFILGAIWLLNSGGCPACPGVNRMIVIVILLSASRAVASLVILRLVFPEPSDEQVSEPVVKGATPDEIAALPKVRFTNDLADDTDTSCAVCLCDYREGEYLRKFPCGHHFHCACADTWLRQNKRCPLCVQPIDNAENKLRRK